MSTNDTKRERLAKELNDGRFGYLAEMNCYGLADFILARQEQREGPLVKALKRLASCEALEMPGVVTMEGRARMEFAERALAAHAALDAEPAPEPTLAEAVEALVRDTQTDDDFPPRLQGVSRKLFDAVRAALARERAKEGTR